VEAKSVVGKVVNWKGGSEEKKEEEKVWKKTVGGEKQ
jgi:hypothetical protein